MAFHRLLFRPISGLISKTRKAKRINIISDKNLQNMHRLCLYNSLHKPLLINQSILAKISKFKLIRFFKKEAVSLGKDFSVKIYLFLLKLTDCKHLIID